MNDQQKKDDNKNPNQEAQDPSNKDQNGGEQKEQEEEPIALGGIPKKRNQINSFYDPPLPKPGEKFDPAEKREMERMRRWKVLIQDIEIQNTSGEPFDPFIQFIIGGDFFVEIKVASNGKVQNNRHGERGIVYQTDVIKFLDVNESKIFKTEIDTEHRASYFQLMEERLHMELWDRNGIWLNKFVGYLSIPTLDIVSGSVKQCVTISEEVKEGKAPRQMAALNFNIYFEEVWDFHLTFMDWKATNLSKEDDKNLAINPQVEVTLLSEQATNSTSSSTLLKNQKLPHWAFFQDGIKFRGTFNELKMQSLKIQLWNHSLLGKSLIGHKTIHLKQFIATNLIKADMVIHKKKKITEENLRKKPQTCTIQGNMRTGNQPRFQQTGDLEVLDKSENYLVVAINKLHVFDSMDDGGEASVYATVEWSGNVKQTRMVKKANINETLYFNIPIDEAIRKNSNKLSEFLNDELETKSEIVFNIWADTGQVSIQNLGCARLCLSALHNQRFEDKYFVDQKSKQKKQFQCRVYMGTLKLQSAFFENSNNSIQMSMWFQPELPYPGVDLSKLKPREEDDYPPELEENIRNNKFLYRFQQIIQKNFPFDYYIQDRRFGSLWFNDQYKQRHLLPLFLSKITPPDSNLVEFEDNGSLKRGVRTLGEVAHFVRCIPYKNHEIPKIWSSPDFLLSMKIGSVEEHALLMASMFRAVKYDSIKDIEEQFKQKKREQLKLQTIMDLAENMEFDQEPSKQGEPSTAHENKSDQYEKAASVQKPNKKNKKNTGITEEDFSGINDRVFVCLGKLKEGNQPHAWVMTIDKTYSEVTFWEVKSANKYVLIGRVQEAEEKLLQAYLSPNLTESEKRQIEKQRELQRLESSINMSATGMEKNQINGVQTLKGQVQPLQSDGFKQNVPSEESKEVTDDDKESDSDFMDNMDKLVYFEDLDQKYKGNNIDNIGKIKGLSKEKQDHLKELDYFSDECEDLKDRRKPNKFLAQQEMERAKRETKRVDKHLLPVENFYDKKSGKAPESVVLPYANIDLIFNHKNIWANLQNPDPAHVYFHIHNEQQWLPLITDINITHPIVQNELDQEENIQQQPDDKDKNNKRRKRPRHVGVHEFRVLGDYMKPFTSFYDPKAMEPPYSEIRVEKFEASIYREVEVAVKQVRSSRNLNTKIRKSPTTTNILRGYLDFIEDQQCERIDKQHIQVEKGKLNKQIMKLVPENYKIMMLPAYFNYTDPERIRTIIADQANEFLHKTPKKVMFSVGIKVYAFHNSITAVRVVIAKMVPLEEDLIKKLSPPVPNEQKRASQMLGKKALDREAEEVTHKGRNIFKQKQK